MHLLYLGPTALSLKDKVPGGCREVFFVEGASEQSSVMWSTLLQIVQIWGWLESLLVMRCRQYYGLAYPT